MFNLSTIDSKPSIHVTCVKARLQIIVVIVVIIIIIIMFSFQCIWCFIGSILWWDHVSGNKNISLILKEMGISNHLTCLLRNLYAGQEATVRNGHGTTDWFKIGKGARQGCILTPSLFNLYTEYIMPSWMKHKLESRLLGEITITSDTQMPPPLWQKVKNWRASW